MICADKNLKNDGFGRKVDARKWIENEKNWIQNGRIRKQIERKKRNMKENERKWKQMERKRKWSESEVAFDLSYNEVASLSIHPRKPSSMAGINLKNMEDVQNAFPMMGPPAEKIKTKIAPAAKLVRKIKTKLPPKVNSLS